MALRYPSLSTTKVKEVFVLINCQSDYIPSNSARKFWEPLLQNNENYVNYYGSFAGYHSKSGISIVKDVSFLSSPYLTTEVTLAHEYIHYIHQNTISKQRIPTVFDENITVLHSYKVATSRNFYLGQMVIGPLQRAIEQQDPLDLWTAPEYSCTYARYACAYLYGNYGQDCIIRFFNYLESEPSFNDAFYKAFNITDEEFQMQIFKEINEFRKKPELIGNIGYSYPKEWMSKL